MPKKSYANTSHLKYQGTEFDLEFYRHNVYSEPLLNTFLNELKISDDTGRKDMAESILRAAMYYELTMRSHIRSYRSKGHYERSIKATLKPAEALKKQLGKLTDTGPMGFASILHAVEDLVSEGSYPPEAGRYINALYWREGDKNKFDWKGLQSFLEFYQSACKTALKKHVPTNAAHKGYPLETWLFNLRSNWKLCSPIPFTAGRYYERVGYNSEAIHILKKIMGPLDSSVTLQAIANKLMEMNRKAAKK